MQIGMVGLGRMGANMTRRLLRGGHEVVVFDVNASAIEAVATEGATPAASLEALVAALAAPRAVWIMVPAGDITEGTVSSLADLLQSGDCIIDGGNSRYSDTLRRAAELSSRRIALVDSGTSGGVWGLEEGFCLMIGAEEKTFARLEPIFATLAPPEGYARVGGPGAGHFTKMVHNGIEYALMQSYGEGFEILESSEFDLDLGAIAQVWQHGSVIRSWLLDLIASAFEQDPQLAEVSDFVDDSGEGRWTIEYAIDNAIPAPTIATALFHRFASRQDESFSGKVIAALRREFGGHAVHPPTPPEVPEGS